MSGALWVWGIDCGSKCAGFGFSELEGDRLATGLARWRREGERPLPLAESLKNCHGHVYGRARALLHEYPPATIAFEKPMGTHTNPSLVMHTGVIVLALAEAAGLNPWEINVSTWKRIHAHNGTNLSTRERLGPWGKRVGLASRDLDELAGAAIALAARQAWSKVPTKPA